MPENSFDVIVVGGGPGGYVAALRCAQWGMKTALIERAQVGGTCLNRGCIPAKALLHSTGLLRELRLHGKANGLAMDLPTPDLAAIHANKDTTVQKLRGGVELLLQKRGVTILKGEATPLESKDSPAVELKGGEESQPQILKTTHLIWATGARPAELPLPAMLRQVKERFIDEHDRQLG